MSPDVAVGVAAMKWLNVFRAALGVLAIAVPFAFAYAWDVTSVNNVVCGALILVSTGLGMRWVELKWPLIPIALWLGGAPILFAGHDGAIYCDLFIGHMLLFSVIPTAEMFEP